MAELIRSQQRPERLRWSELASDVASIKMLGGDTTADEAGKILALLDPSSQVETWDQDAETRLERFRIMCRGDLNIYASKTNLPDEPAKPREPNERGDP